MQIREDSMISLVMQHLNRAAEPVDAGGFDFGGMDMGDIFGDIFGDLFGGGSPRACRAYNGPMKGAEYPNISMRISI